MALFVKVGPLGQLKQVKEIFEREVCLPQNRTENRARNVAGVLGNGNPKMRLRRMLELRVTPDRVVNKKPGPLKCANDFLRFEDRDAGRHAARC